MHKAVCCFVCKLSPSYMYFYPSVITGQRKPGAILTSTPGVASDFSLTVNFQCRLSFLFSLFFSHYNKYNTCQYTCSNSFMVFVQLPCATTCINIYMHIKHPKCWKSYHYLDTQKYCTHGWEWVPLLLWLLYPYEGKQPSGKAMLGVWSEPFNTLRHPSGGWCRKAMLGVWSEPFKILHTRVRMGTTALVAALPLRR